MQRKKGQFTSSKAISEDSGSASLEWNAGSGQEEQETSLVFLILFFSFLYESEFVEEPSPSIYFLTS